MLSDGFGTTCKSVILSEASPGFGDAESKDPYSLRSVRTAKRHFNDAHQVRAATAFVELILNRARLRPKSKSAPHA